MMQLVRKLLQFQVFWSQDEGLRGKIRRVLVLCTVVALGFCLSW